MAWIIKTKIYAPQGVAKFHIYRNLCDSCQALNKSTWTFAACSTSVFILLGLCMGMGPRTQMWGKGLHCANILDLVTITFRNCCIRGHNVRIKCSGTHSPSSFGCGDSLFAPWSLLPLYLSVSAVQLWLINCHSLWGKCTFTVSFFFH